MEQQRVRDQPCGREISIFDIRYVCLTRFDIKFIRLSKYDTAHVNSFYRGFRFFFNFANFAYVFLLLGT